MFKFLFEQIEQLYSTNDKNLHNVFLLAFLQLIIHYSLCFLTLKRLMHPLCQEETVYSGT
jgi:hypothetical protein